MSSIKTFVIKSLLLSFLIVVVQFGKAQCIGDTIAVECGNATVLFQRQQYDTTSGLAFIHIHENETAALQAAQWLFDSVRMGSLTTWHGQQQRYIDFSIGSDSFHFDPNRIYSRDGILATLGADATDTAINLVQAVADTFISHFITGKTGVIAVHNNTNLGNLSVKSYTRGGLYFKDALATYVNPRQDADDFFYTTEASFFQYLKAKGYNVVLQNNDRVLDDGSLSVYCARHQIPYINIEAEADQPDRQKKMLKEVWDLILNKMNGIVPAKD